MLISKNDNLRGKPILKNQTNTPQSKLILLRQSAQAAESKKSPSRKILQSGLLYTLNGSKKLEIKGILHRKKVVDFLSKSTTLFGGP